MASDGRSGEESAEVSSGLDSVVLGGECRPASRQVRRDECRRMEVGLMKAADEWRVTGETDERVPSDGKKRSKRGRKMSGE